MGQRDKEKLKKNLNTLFIPVILTITLFILSFYLLALPTIRSSMLQSQKNMIAELTNIASEIADEYHKKFLDGELSEEEAKLNALEGIKYLRYGKDGKGYFWVNDLSGLMLMHPFLPEYVGQNMADYEDPDGTPIFIDFIRIASNEGSGYTEYKWQFKDDSTKTALKLSYVKLFKPWDWIVGTGIYIDEVEQDISTLTNKIIFVFSLILLLLIGLLYYLLGKSFKMAMDGSKYESKYYESEQYYRKIFDTLNDSIMVYDFHDGEVIDVNQTGNQMFGYSKAELKTLKIFGEDNLAAFDYIKSSLNEGKLIFEIFVFKKNGIKIFSEINLRISKLGGKKCIIVVIKDISNRENLR